MNSQLDYILNVVMNSQLDYILNVVCDETGLTYDELTSKSRHRFLADARKIYFYAAKTKTKMSLATIGGHIGKDHATVMHGIRVLNNVMPYDENLRKICENVMRRMDVVDKIYAIETIAQL